MLTPEPSAYEEFDGTMDDLLKTVSTNNPVSFTSLTVKFLFF